ncbi:uncharacterized protein LOC113315470 [Papaver somniferum]|uniref:uncharacterized protein LOC113315470 n=1 Tax=Papaver somniferum TaxID=3469 RepID=UPI000E703DC4|nr:uncharacterized protein LOC113315470 [Papaver somniferum]
MEEVLSRGITQFVHSEKLQPMVNRKGIHPIHLMFADDVFIFTNGSKRCLNNLLHFLKQYQDSSGQIINRSKSKCFVDGFTPERKQQVSTLLYMDLTSFPNKYLGVILMPGRVKSSIIWPVVEMMQTTLARWKGKLLSFHDILILIKSVLSSYPVYSMAIYKWPKTIIKI